MENNADKLKRTLMDLHKPVFCSECGKAVKYVGLGEYRCPVCEYTMYDDYGKVRAYLEANKGATPLEVAKNSGVDRDTVIYLLETDRLEFVNKNNTLTDTEEQIKKETNYIRNVAKRNSIYKR